MSRLYNKYCCCIVREADPNLPNQLKFCLDVMTFPNPDKEPDALEQCKDRAKALKGAGKSVMPMIMQEIL